VNSNRFLRVVDTLKEISNLGCENKVAKLRGMAEIMANRRSCRDFSTKKVDFGLIAEILRQSEKAPSAGNLKAYNVCIAGKKATIRALAKAAYNQNWIKKAQYVLIFSTNETKNVKIYNQRGKLYAVQDATIACAYAQLAAEAIGLATCWVGAFNPKKITETAKLNEQLTPIALLPISYRKGEKVWYIPKKEAMLSGGYKHFRSMFETICKSCGGTHCSTSAGYIPKTLFITRYDQMHIGFACMKCGATWRHSMSIKEFMKEIKKRKEGEEWQKKLKSKKT